MINLNSASLLDTIKKEELALKGINSLSMNIVSFDHTIDKDFNVMYRTTTNDNIINSLVDKVHSSNDNYLNYGQLFDNLTKNIHVVDTTESGTTIEEAIGLIKTIQESIGDDFYGALIVNGTSVILNPLHPLTCHAIIDNPQMLLMPAKKILVYTYSDLPLNNFVANEQESEEYLALLVASYLSKEDSNILASNKIPFKVVIDGNEVSTYGTEYMSNVFNPTFVIANQILSRGTFIPYYSASVYYLNKDESTVGGYLTPMLMANISKSTNNKAGSVCTGTKNNRTLEGLKTHSHCNMSSPYNRETLSPISLSWAKVCVQYTLSKYKEIL